MAITVGQVVKYAKPGRDEQHIRFTVVEVNGDRCFIELIDAFFAIKPIELVNCEDVVVA